ncbi:hypothetical protein [Stenotrophomonas chelatiphaga]|uniref:hypothetical protein n=1 Tax=Stenotrophomonas chelatiphaga TaxID=517011 RepID=UPI002896BEB9|nr:hypothetical protein [Stenotrophomonas chelatiphaga]
MGSAAQRSEQVPGVPPHRPGGVGILAGNSRVSLDSDGVIEVQAQLRAFDAALALARGYREAGLPMPRVSVAFDHRGIFRTQFLDDGLSNSQKRRPRLSHLHPAIRTVFEPAATRHQIALGDIHAIREDSARQHLSHTLALGGVPERLVRSMLAGITEPPAGEDPQVPTQRLTCAAITTEYFARAAGDAASGTTLLEVFFEDSAWSGRLAYGRGLQLCHLLGSTSTIRLNLVSDCGVVSQGAWIAPKPAGAAAEASAAAASGRTDA